MVIRLRAGPADCLYDFLEQRVSACQLFPCKISKRKEVITSSSSHLIRQLLVADYLITYPHCHIIRHTYFPLDHHSQHFNSDDTNFLRPVGSFPYLDELYGEGWVDVLGFNNSDNTLYGFFCQFFIEESVEKVSVKTSWRLEEIENAVEQYEGSSGVGWRLNGLVQELLKFYPVLYLNNRKKNADQRCYTSLNKQVSLLGILLQ